MRNFLKTFGIHVGSEWLKACVEYVVQEFGNAGDSADLQSRVEQEVFNQFLHADLHEIYDSSSEQEKKSEFTLVDHLLNNCHGQVMSDTFVLQLDTVRDISRSMEDQLDEVDFSDERQHSSGAGDDDMDDYENEQRAVYESSMKQYSSQPNGSGSNKYKFAANRMLYLTCTDGKSTIGAMEYKPISQLSQDALQPGCKIAFKDVLIRREVMMLIPGTIEILGGSVEHLVQSEKQKKEDLADRIQGKPLRSEQIQLQQQAAERAARRNIPVPTSASRPKIEEVEVEPVILDDQYGNDLGQDYDDFNDLAMLDDDFLQYSETMQVDQQNQNDRIPAITTSRVSPRTPNLPNESTNSSISLLESDSDDDIQVNESSLGRAQANNKTPQKKSKLPSWYREPTSD